ELNDGRFFFLSIIFYSNSTSHFTSVQIQMRIHEVTHSVGEHHGPHGSSSIQERPQHGWHSRWPEKAYRPAGDRFASDLRA
ncbi:MAG: hypothetical protein UT02_C0009G0018, partial [Parcubacteria group bacterium GW2011_GWC2_38_7]